jgi:hypothetical protein
MMGIMIMMFVADVDDDDVLLSVCGSVVAG